MSSVIAGEGRRKRTKGRKSLAPDLYERGLAYGSMLMLAAVVLAVARGAEEWGRVPPVVWAHLLTVMAAWALSPPLLLRPRGTPGHRRLGWAWAAAMVTTAGVSLFVHEGGGGRWSPIHLLSLLTLAGVPLTVWAARTHRVEAHRAGVRAAVTGALLVAGFFTFPFGRMLGRWLLG